jgi:hypothetical protein
VIYVWIADGAPYVLPQEQCSADRLFVTLIAGVVRNDARGSGRFVVVAFGHLWATPCAAQQRGVLPNRYCQHDRQYKCSKHVMLSSGRRARRTPTTRRERVTNQARFGTFSSLLGQACGISPPGVENPAARLHRQPVHALGRRSFERRSDTVPNDTPRRAARPSVSHNVTMNVAAASIVPTAVKKRRSFQL